MSKITFLIFIISLFCSKVDFSQVQSPSVNSITLLCGDTNFTLVATPGTGGNSVLWYDDYLCANLLGSGLTYTGVTHKSIMIYAKSVNTITGYVSKDPTQVYVFKPIIPAASIRLDTSTFGCSFNLIVSQDTAIDELTIVAVEDATIDMYARNTNYNNNFLNITSVNIHRWTGSAHFITKFDLTVFPLSVRPYMSCLQMVAFAGFAHNLNGNVFTQLIPNDSWSENSVTYNTAQLPAIRNSIANSYGRWWIWYGFPSRAIAHGGSANMGGNPEGNKSGRNCDNAFNQMLTTEYLNDKTLSTYHFSPNYCTRYYSKDYKTNVSLLPQISSSFSYNHSVSCSYSWTGPNGFTSNSKDLFNLKDTGDYILTIASPFGDCDTVLRKKVTTFFSIDTIFNTDTICANDSIFLGGDNVSTTGIYYDTLFSLVGCDSLVQTNLYVLPPVIVNLGNDTSLCAEFSTLLEVDIKNVSYLWQDGSINSSIIATPPGLYYVSVETDRGCVSRDSVRLFLLPSPIANLGNDTTVCFQQGPLLLDAKNIGSTYIWNDATIAQTNLIDSPGGYNVIVTNTDGCSDTAQIVVMEECPVKVFIPNSFTPNKDGVNDFFEIKGESISEISLSIFNKWGGKVFESNSLNDLWDGTYLGEDVKEDVYVWRVIYKGLDGFAVYEKIGYVTLLRRVEY